MESRRIYAVGDIHGCYQKLKTMMSRLDWRPGQGDLLVFLGDYIDRGPQSYEVVEMLIDLQGQAPDEVITLMGNHERMFLDFITGQVLPPLFANGMAATVLDYCRGDNDMSEAHMGFYKDLRYYYETEDYIFVHAGLMPGRSLDDQELMDLLWIREPFLQSDYDFGKTVVFGHTPFINPMVAPGRLGLDTGAVYGGPLTAVVLPELKFVYAD